MSKHEKELSDLEALFNSGTGDRKAMHQKLNELKGILSFEPNPVLRAEYVRRLGLLDGSSARIRQQA